MLTEFGYLVAWVVYLSCAVILYWSLGLLINKMGPKIIQYVFKSLLAVLLFTPAVSVPDQNVWAPAYLVTVYSYIQDEHFLAFQAGLWMVGAWCVVCLLMSLSYILKRIRQKSPSVQVSPQQREAVKRPHQKAPLPEPEPAPKSHSLQERNRVTPTT